MKKITIFYLLSLYCGKNSFAQPWNIDFGTTNNFYQCNPAVYTSTGQSQCKSVNPVSAPVGQTVMYYSTDAGSVGGSFCRNWIELQNPGYTFIGSSSELQIRGAGGGFTQNFPARFVVKDFPGSEIFAISFEMAITGYLGSWIFRCGTGKVYEDTVYIRNRDTCSFMCMRIYDYNPGNNPIFQYSNSSSNLMWPNVPSYSWQSDIGDTLHRWQKYKVDIFCNNSNTLTAYYYNGTQILNPRSYSVYIDSVQKVNNLLDTLIPVGRQIDAFMFCGDGATCSNGTYAGDSLIVDNIRWTNNFVSSPLPVELAKFKVECEDDGECVNVEWTTYSEHENMGFSLLREGKEVVFISSCCKGYSNIPHVYTYRDCVPVSGENENSNRTFAYRLIQVDYNGERTDLGVRVVRCSEMDIGVIYENEMLQIARVHVDTKISVEVIDVAGKTVAKNICQGECAINLRSLVNGVYVAKVMFNNKVISKKIVK